MCPGGHFDSETRSICKQRVPAIELKTVPTMVLTLAKVTAMARMDPEEDLVVVDHLDAPGHDQDQENGEETTDRG